MNLILNKIKLSITACNLKNLLKKILLPPHSLYLHPVRIYQVEIEFKIDDKKLTFFFKCLVAAESKFYHFTNEYLPS